MSPEPPLLAGEDASQTTSRQQGHVVEVDESGDIVLDVTFETSHAVLKKSRKALPPADRTLKPRPPATTKVAYRVRIAALKGNSRYFAHLFSNPQFSEARLVAETHDGLMARGVNPSEAGARDLPFIALVDDDEATQAAGRELVFEDMLRILHRKPIKTAKVVMPYAVTLAIVADRFDCVDTVARTLNGHHKFKWPIINSRPLTIDDRGRMAEVEQTMRQKVLVSWLLGQPLRLQQATRELIVRGSSLWSAFHDADANTERAAAWWNLPQGLERELQHRRECILNAVASVQRHFFKLYASRDRQCKLGYDSSAACDSFQLGQMLKFLTSKELLYLVDFSPGSLDSVPDTSRLDLEELVTTLKQFPNYQVDRHHINCGPQIRIKPIMDYLRTMLSANVISISHADWTRRRADVSWAERKDSNGAGDSGHTFAFTRAIANDQRLHHEGTFHADRIAKSLFTADSWDWTPEA
ncbi:protein related to hydroxyproline-rich glycoprotein [Hirsutella rhossiliensis]|uniref:Proteinrelated to hydroxyproline-rich glycoprotein n=1 Tax=Hirsutella rhossiliensis TaxID=111463 RepID=A0A9P8SMQ2_9HYPO|nr:proteinrelated to hydroxyproline-rich glycoprotein [Hirsutella rhossiliensis]KAH0967100.1 proteinrelated to hydroxyproline-rich glycoprotein [Hirsutella rhossiliensis]